jgi:hypothetical protein
VIAKL